MLSQSLPLHTHNKNEHDSCNPPFKLHLLKLRHPHASAPNLPPLHPIHGAGDRPLAQTPRPDRLQPINPLHPTPLINIRQCNSKLPSGLENTIRPGRPNPALPAVRGFAEASDRIARRPPSSVDQVRHRIRQRHPKPRDSFCTVQFVGGLVARAEFGCWAFYHF